MRGVEGRTHIILLLLTLLSGFQTQTSDTTPHPNDATASSISRESETSMTLSSLSASTLPKLPDIDSTSSPKLLLVLLLIPRHPMSARDVVVTLVEG